MRLIDADALLEAGRNTVEFRQQLADEYVLECLIVGAPIVDAVEVVRCRECSRANQYDDGSDNFVCSLGGTRKGSDFCSEGERREENALIDEKKYIKKSYLRKMAMCEPQYTMETEKDVETLMRLIEDAPLVDVAPVRHGRWVRLSYGCYADGSPVYDEWECSECHFRCSGEGEPNLNYCPHCGAKMEGKNEDGID